MTDEKFITDTYNKIKEAILAFNDNVVSDIYALSLYIYKGDDDPRRPMLTLGYNTTERWKSCCPSVEQEPEWPIASDTCEAKWNYAFWLQNEELVIGGYAYDPVSEWVKQSSYYYTDKQADTDFDTTYLLGEQLQEKFLGIVISHAQKLHAEGIIKAKFAKSIPIIIHELEYYDKPVQWTKNGNPEGLAQEFENWISSF